MKYTYIFLCIVLFLCSCKKDMEVVDSPKKDEPKVHFFDEMIFRSAVKCSDESIMLCGYQPNLAKIAKLSANGDILFSRIYSTGGTNSLMDVVETLDGNFLFISGSNILKTDENSTEVWLRSYTSVDTPLRLNKIKRTPDDNFIAAGYIHVDYEQYLSLIKINKDADIIWQHNWLNIRSKRITDVLVTVDGSFIITGVDEEYPSQPRIYLAKFSPDGLLLWQTTNQDYPESTGLKTLELENGDLLTCGYSGVMRLSDMTAVIVKTNTYGQTIWTKSFGEIGHENTFNDMLLENNSIIITGYDIQTGVGSSAMLLSLSLDGIEKWRKMYKGSYNSGKTLLPYDEGYVILGNAESGMRSFFVIFVDKNGEIK